MPDKSSKPINNLLLDAIKRSGYRSVAEFAKKSGLDYKKLTLLTNDKCSPINKNGDLTDVAIKICIFLKKGPHLLFGYDDEISDDHVFNDQTVSIQKPISFDLVDPYRVKLRKQVREAIDHAVNSLTGREQKIIRLRFGFDCNEHTLNELSQIFQVSHSRIMQIEAKALRKLRHPSRTQVLENIIFNEKIILKPEKISQTDWEAAKKEIIEKHTRQIENRVQLKTAQDKFEESLAFEKKMNKNSIPMLVV